MRRRCGGLGYEWRRRVSFGRTVTGTGAGTQHYVFDGTNMVLAFDVNDNLTDRYLWGPAVDQVLADEHFSYGSGSNQLPGSATPFTTLWALGDNQNTVRDVVTDNGTLEQHIAYSPFGQQVSGLTTTGSVVANFAFGYTGTYTDPVTGLQLHGVRWYNPSSQRWLTQDPLGLGPDTNPYRYCGNGPTDGTDPSGMGTITFPYGNNNVPTTGTIVGVDGNTSVTVQLTNGNDAGQVVTVPYSTVVDRTSNPDESLDNFKAIRAFRKAQAGAPQPTTNDVPFGSVATNNVDQFVDKVMREENVNGRYVLVMSWYHSRTEEDSGSHDVPTAALAEGEKGAAWKINSAADLIKDIKHLSNDCYVAVLEISVHATPWDIRLGAGDAVVKQSNVKAFADALAATDKLYSFHHGKTVIILNGCNAGSLRRSFWRTLAKTTKATVFAPVGFTTGTFYGADEVTHATSDFGGKQMTLHQWIRTLNDAVQKRIDISDTFDSQADVWAKYNP